MKMLVDNVAVQAVEACLLSQLSSIISPTSVMTMTDDTVASIAAEPEDNQALREQLDRKLAGKLLRSFSLLPNTIHDKHCFHDRILTSRLYLVLQSGLDICKRYAGGPKSTTLSLNKLQIGKPSRGTSSTSTSESRKSSRVRMVRL